jgi:hypothetical protein
MRRPSPGTVLGTLALIVAVAGNANAFAGRDVIVRKGDIAKGAVTAKALASGAVTAKAIKAGAVGSKAIKPGAVTSAAIGQDAVTASAIAPGSVYGGALGPVSVHSTPISDPDEAADLSTWSASNPETAQCANGERLLSGGLAFTDAGNRRVGIVQSVPTLNGQLSGWAGQITSDSGGTAKAEVQAVCLK